MIRLRHQSFCLLQQRDPSHPGFAMLQPNGPLLPGLRFLCRQRAERGLVVQVSQGRLKISIGYGDKLHIK
jgi:hypothetical protein